CGIPQFPESSSYHQGDCFVGVVCVTRYRPALLRNSGCTSSARSHQRSSGTPGGCVGRTSGCPQTDTERARRSVKHGGAPRRNGLNWPAAVAGAELARPLPALQSSTVCRPATQCTSCANTTALGQWKRPRSGDTSSTSQQTEPCSTCPSRW